MFATLDMWSSVLSSARASTDELRDVVKRIEKVIGYDLRGEQIGNIVNKLRELHEFDLIDELEAAIDEYNQRKEWLKKAYAWAATPAQKRAVKEWLSDADCPWQNMSAGDAIALIKQEMQS
jgi:uncharacterized protein YpuA (DUF1002 family)